MIIIMINIHIYFFIYKYDGISDPLKIFRECGPMWTRILMGEFYEDVLNKFDGNMGM